MITSSCQLDNIRAAHTTQKYFFLMKIINSDGNILLGMIIILIDLKPCEDRAAVLKIALTFWNGFGTHFCASMLWISMTLNVNGTGIHAEIVSEHINNNCQWYKLTRGAAISFYT